MIKPVQAVSKLKSYFSIKHVYLFYLMSTLLFRFLDIQLNKTNKVNEN